MAWPGLRFVTGGESHGPQLTAVVDGFPAGLSVNRDEIDYQLARRQQGYGRGGRMAIERDRVSIAGGVRRGKTTGAPVVLVIENRDWVNWERYMQGSPDVDESRAVRVPRPGHADLPGAIKYGHYDIRDVLERSSARETAARTAVGALARILLSAVGITISGKVLQIGPMKFKGGIQSDDTDEELARLVDEVRLRGDTLGGIFEVTASGVPVGLGSYSQWDRRLDGRLAGAIMSIPGIKGVEIGMGFEAAGKYGSEVHDPIYYHPAQGFYRQTNGAGGIEGGVTNGQPVVIRAAMKPIPTLLSPLPSVDLITKEVKGASVERSDVCAIFAAEVVGEAVLAWELASALLEKFGGDSLAELETRVEQWREYVQQF